MGTIYGNGLDQGDLVDLLALIKTNMNGVLAKLDADGGVHDTDYASLLALTIPSGIDVAVPKGVRDQGVVQDFLSSVVTNFNALLAKLDADATVNDTDYAATKAMTNPIGLTAGKTMQGSGMFQGGLVHLLNHVITQFNALNAKLDADSQVSGTNYRSLWNIADTVDESGTAA